MRIEVDDLRRTGCLYRTIVCTAAGLVTAALYALLAAASYHWGGGKAELDPLSLSLTDMIALYFKIGVAGGVLVGVMLPLARNRIGAALVGYPIGALYGGALALLVGADVYFALMMGLLCGVPVAVIGSVIVWQPLGKAYGS